MRRWKLLSGNASGQITRTEAYAPSVTRKRKGWVLLGALAIGAGIFTQCGGCFERPLRVGTYNIEQFGNKRQKTDIDRLVTIIAKADPDVLAVQEIQNARSLQDLAKRLSQGRRSYKIALSDCGGGSEMKVGVLYDENRTKVKATNDGSNLHIDRPGARSDDRTLGGAARKSEANSEEAERDERTPDGRGRSTCCLGENVENVCSHPCKNTKRTPRMSRKTRILAKGGDRTGIRLVRRVAVVRPRFVRLAPFRKPRTGRPVLRRP